MQKLVLLMDKQNTCGSDIKESSCNAGHLDLIPGLGRSPGEGNGYLPNPVLLPEEFHAQRSLAGYMRSKKSDTTKRLTLSPSLFHR